MALQAGGKVLLQNSQVSPEISAHQFGAALPVQCGRVVLLWNLAGAESVNAQSSLNQNFAKIFPDHDLTKWPCGLYYIMYTAVSRLSNASTHACWSNLFCLSHSSNRVKTADNLLCSSSCFSSSKKPENIRSIYKVEKHFYHYRCIPARKQVTVFVE